MSRSNPNSYGSKVTSRTIDIQALVREAEGGDWDMPYYIYSFNNDSRRFVTYDVYDWTKIT